MNLLYHLPLTLWQAQVDASASSEGISWFMAVLAFLAMLIILVFVHELGHFLVALWMRIPVEEFGIGFPPRAVTLFEHKGVKYTLNWLPLGGFVRFGGEDNSVYGVGSLAEAKPWRKIPVMVAGPLMNLLLAILIFAVIFVTVGIQTANGARISEVFPGSPAEQAGIQADDVLISLAGQPLDQMRNLGVVREVAENNLRMPVEAVVQRDGTEVTLEIVPGVWASNDGETEPTPLGFSYTADQIEHTPTNPFTALVASVGHSFELVGTMIHGLSALIGGLFQLNEPPAGGVAGPIGIARATGEVIELGGWPAFWSWMAVFSINLFLLNLLPIPALDGSHIVFSLIEWLRGGKKVPPEKEAMVHAIGFMALMGLMVLVSISDVVSAIRGQSVLGGG